MKQVGSIVFWWVVSRRQGPRSRSCLAHGWPVENDEGAEGGRGADLQRWIPSSLKNLGEVCWWRSSAGTLGGFCASATSWSKWHISKASRNQKTSKGEKLPREGTNLVIQSFLLETCTRTMSWYYCTNMTFGDFYRKWRKKARFFQESHSNSWKSSLAGSRAGSQVESTGTHNTKMTTDAQEAQERWCTKMRMSAEAPLEGRGGFEVWGCPSRYGLVWQIVC